MNVKKTRPSGKKVIPPKWKKFVDELACFADKKPVDKKKFSERKPDQLRILSTLQVLVSLMAYVQQSLDDSFYVADYLRWFYGKILKNSKAFRKGTEYRHMDLSPLKTPYLPDLTPKRIQHLIKFYEKLNRGDTYPTAFKDYCDAVKDGLFLDMYVQAYSLKLVLDKYSNLEELYDKSCLYESSRELFPKIKSFISLVERGLYPVFQWGIEARDRKKTEVYLEKIGKNLNPVKRGKQRKRPYLYEIAIFILYYVLLEEFKKAGKLRTPAAKIVLLKEGIASLISTKNDWSLTGESNKAAKRVIMRVFGVNRVELNRIISKNNEDLLLKNLESLKAIFPEFK